MTFRSTFHRGERGDVLPVNDLVWLEREPFFAVVFLTGYGTATGINRPAETLVAFAVVIVSPDELYTADGGNKKENKEQKGSFFHDGFFIFAPTV